MSAKLTPWFESHIKPIRKGVYEVTFSSVSDLPVFPVFSFWDGNRWGTIRDTAQEARIKYWFSSASHDQLMWRGRACKP